MSSILVKNHGQKSNFFEVTVKYFARNSIKQPANRLCTLFRYFTDAVNSKIKEHCLFYRKDRLKTKIKYITTTFEGLHDEKIFTGYYQPQEVLMKNCNKIRADVSAAATQVLWRLLKNWKTDSKASGWTQHWSINTP